MGSYSFLASIDGSLSRDDYTRRQIQEDVADLRVMYESRNMEEYQYKNLLALLESKL